MGTTTKDVVSIHQENVQMVVATIATIVTEHQTTTIVTITIVTITIGVRSKAVETETTETTETTTTIITITTEEEKWLCQIKKRKKSQEKKLNVVENAIIVLVRNCVLCIEFVI